MPRISSFSQRVGGAVAAALLAAPAHADPAIYQGPFTAADDLLPVHFTLAGTRDAGDCTLVLSQDGNLPPGPMLAGSYALTPQVSAAPRPASGSLLCGAIAALGLSRHRA